MITLKQILAQIRPRDWFSSVDLKDAYFHIQITPHHRCFLRFSFEGTAYQSSVLPFGLALAPSTFSKCLDAALSPLRASRMRILNYLDDWLILAQSRDTLLSHIASSLGLCVNKQKSILVPSQSITYLGVCFDSVEMRTCLSQERLVAILFSLRYFRLGSSVHYTCTTHAPSTVYIHIYAFSKRFYPKRLTVHSGYTFFVSMCVPWESNPQPLLC